MATDLDDEIGRLRRRVDELETRLPGSSKTTKAQRQALRKHVEELDKAIKEKAKKAAAPIIPVRENKLKAKDFVAEDLFNEPRTKGAVVYIACRFALPKYRKGENACDRKTCQHKSKHYVWVLWPDRSMISYHFTKLRLLTDDDLKPKIGRELSGRIGPWFYDAEKKIWKKDGDDKEYNHGEFEDAMYYEDHPGAKEEAANLLKAILNLGRPRNTSDYGSLVNEDDIHIDDSDFHKS